MLDMMFDRDGKPIDSEEFDRLFSDMDYRRVGETIIGDIKISTVWLGVNHNFGSEGPPLIFESMIFGGNDDLNECQWRYPTFAEAMIGHCKLIKLVQTRLSSSK